MRLKNFQKSDRLLSCCLEWGGQSFDLFFDFGDSEVDPKRLSLGGNWGLAASILVAMRLGEHLELDAPISGLLAGNLQVIQHIYSSWIPGLKLVSVSAEFSEPGQSGPATGLFFSGGVDSFHSLIRHDDSISDLILVHGFDIPFTDDSSFLNCLRPAENVAQKFRKKLIVVRTNLRQLTDRFVGWGYLHGSAMASVGLCLDGVLSRCIVASSSYTYRDLHPWGSHPLLDPLWSTETLQFVHDGAECPRIEKLRLICRNRTALDTLRVCWEGGAGANCGRCEKCLRTMVGLQCIGELNNCKALPREIDADAVARLSLDEHGVLFWEEFLEFPLDDRLRQAIHSIIRNEQLGLPPTDGTIRSRLRRMVRVGQKAAKLLVGM